MQARKQLTQVGRNALGSHRALFPLLGLSGTFRRRMVRPGADACIDGYPRSGNSYATRAFRAWNPGLRVAHHVHLPMQVVRAVELGIPCAVLVRDPLDAIGSLLIAHDERITDGVAFRAYINFYRRAIAAEEGVVTCRFEEVIADPAVVVRRLNDRYGTSFRSAPTDPEQRSRLLAAIERTQRGELSALALSVPSAEKDRRKRDVRARLARNPLHARAEAVYARWTVRGPGAPAVVADPP